MVTFAQFWPDDDDGEIAFCHSIYFASLLSLMLFLDVAFRQWLLFPLAVVVVVFVVFVVGSGGVKSANLIWAFHFH